LTLVSRLKDLLGPVMRVKKKKKKKKKQFMPPEGRDDLSAHSHDFATRSCIFFFFFFVTLQTRVE